jgi:hypothetical protein
VSKGGKTNRRLWLSRFAFITKKRERNYTFTYIKPVPGIKSKKKNSVWGKMAD